MKKYFKNRDTDADIEIAEMKTIYESGKFHEPDIRKIVAEQKGTLSVNSIYWKKEKIAEGNWSKVEDSKLETLDKEEVDAEDIIYGLDTYEGKRQNNAEIEYVFMPSYYAVMTLINCYLKDKREALKIYGLKNAILRKEIKKDEEFYYGGLPFILKYIEKISKDKSFADIKSDFTDIMEKLLECECVLKINQEKDEFINDIINCIKKSKCKDFILEKRIKDCEFEKDKYIECKIINEYKILEHRDVEKDWKHLKEAQIRKANEIIENTPYFPKNVPPKNDPLTANIKGWYSQRVSKKDRVVYMKDSDKKTIYIATVCDHYKDAERRSKSKESYR